MTWWFPSSTIFLITIFRWIGALSITKTDVIVNDGYQYMNNQPSKPSAFKLPVNIIGGIKSFFHFILPRTKFSLFSSFLAYLQKFFSLFLTTHKYNLEILQFLTPKRILNFYHHIFWLISVNPNNILSIIIYFFAR